jgi:Glycine rich protein
MFSRQIEAGLCAPAGARRAAQPRCLEGWPVRRCGGGRARLVAAVALVAGLAALVLPAGAGAAPDCQTSGAETVCTFEYTGAAESWTVPFGVSEARFDVYGAQGGTSDTGGVGGLGGRATATIAVTAAQTLEVNVGGAGGDGGGFNGGGAGTRDNGGGGGSDVRFAPYGLADRAIVGGGGGGGGSETGGGGGGGGAGGGASGGDGADSGSPGRVAQGGGGGTQTAGGAGGSAGPVGGFTGGAGGFGTGGGAGDGSDFGGAGGGGYWGGGGGGGNFGREGGGGGGGGSGFGPDGVAFESGVRAGDGLVTITYTTPDAGAPTSTIALDPDGPDGRGGWHVSAVQARVVAVDEAGGSGVSETRCVLDPASVPTSFDELPVGCPYADPGADVVADGEHVLYAASIDHAGNTEAPVKQAFKLDRSAPTVDCEAPDGRWHAADVSLSCSASDGGAGLADAADADFSLTTSVVPDSETANAATNGRTIEDAAGNSTSVGPIADIKVDKLAPAITIEGPTAGGYSYGQAVAAAYGCDDGGSGLASCAGPVAAGQQIDTATAGAHTFTITATDRAGNTSSRTVDYTVASPPPATSPPRSPAPSSLLAGPAAPPAPSLRMDVAPLSVFGPRAGIGCRMADGPIRSCRVRLLAGGRVVARGARRVHAARGRLRVTLALTAQGRRLLEQRLGGLRATVAATGTANAASDRAKAPTRALLAVERLTTPAGAWLPNRAQLSSRGKRFLRGLRGKLIAVAALRCDGHAARVHPNAPHAQALSRARAALICSALNRLGAHAPTTITGHGDTQPLAPNTNPAGRAHNRRVEITLKHQT